MINTDTLARRPAASPARPLPGLTVLAVEDSRFASEALRLLCLRSGARIRRADSLRATRRHLQVYRPCVAIIDPGLPDGSGLDLIAELDRARPRIGVILGLSGDPGLEAAVLRAGADGFLAKPVTRLAQFQQEILRHLPKESGPAGPYALSKERVTPDPLAYRDDLAHIHEVLSASPDGTSMAYAAQFLIGLARTAVDDSLLRAATGLTGGGARAGLAHVIALIEARLAEPLEM